MTPSFRRGLAVMAALTLPLGLMVAVPAAAQARTAETDIVNGRPPVAREFGFLASVEVQARDGGYYVCGGSFVSPTQVVTAAHCVFDERGRPVKAVMAGPASALRRPTAPVRASKWEAHEDYSHEGTSHDIALITLSRPVSGVTPVTIPTADEWQSLAVPGAPARTAGWGLRASAPGATSPAKFLVADLEIIADSVCGDSRQTVRIGSVTFEGIGASFDPDTMICAGGATAQGLPVDTCQGDSGGPLVAGRDASPVLVGIVSWGVGCAGVDQGKRGDLTPGVYTRLATYLPWLAERGVGRDVSATLPGAPLGLKATIAEPGRFALSWTAPASDGGAPITAYQVDQSVDGGEWVTLGLTDTAETSIDVTDVEPGFSYRYRVAAVNSEGVGDYSQPSAPVTMPSEVLTTPGKVDGFSKSRFTRSGSTYRVTVRWKEPLQLGGSAITGYVARYGTGSRWGPWTPLSGASAGISELRPGTTYSVQVRAVNAQGPGESAFYSFTTPR